MGKLGFTSDDGVLTSGILNTRTIIVVGGWIILYQMGNNGSKGYDPLLCD